MRRQSCRQPAPTPIHRRRIALLALGVAAWAMTIEGRLIWLQVYRHRALLSAAADQHWRTFALPPRRGDIVDRHGRTLALSVEAASVVADPGRITSPAETAAAVCAALAACGADERGGFVRRLEQPRSFVYLQRQIGPVEAARIEALDLPGVWLIPESRRFYPNRDLAAHVLGYVGTDSTGLAGIELSHDAPLRGRAGSMRLETDARGRGFRRVETPAVSGATLELTIDTGLQHICEAELRRAVVEEEAAAGSVVLVDPPTGHVLAMAVWPTFNPNVFGRFPAGVRRNRAVQDVYEPGSTFKVVTASAAVEARVFASDELIDVSDGAVRIGTRVIEDVHRHDRLSVTDVVVESSNVGAIVMGTRVGPARLERYARAFGFGQRVCRDLPGESAGLLSESTGWSAGTTASVSMGYEIGVTPAQMVAAISAIANNGVWVPLRLVREGGTGQHTGAADPAQHRLMSSDAAATVVDMLEQVVRRGTGARAAVPGYATAGKTGTAAKVIDGTYSTTEYVASFAGFVPARDPAFAMIVVIDSPRGRPGRIYGGEVAAPVFRRIAERALEYLGLPHTRRIPDVRGLDAREAVRRLAAVGVAVELSGNGVVTEQKPGPGALVVRGGTCLLKMRSEIATPGIARASAEHAPFHDER